MPFWLRWEQPCGLANWERGDDLKQFIYRKQIRVSSGDLQSALARRKTCTIRAGLAEVNGSEIELTDGQNRARVKITGVDHSTLAQLSEREVAGEGFCTKQELERDLRQYYRTLKASDPLTVIWFEVI